MRHRILLAASLLYLCAANIVWIAIDTRPPFWDMANHAKDESADVVSIASTIVFDKGLSTEYQQTFDCRVRFDKDKVSDVIYLQFNWNKDDLRKVNPGS